MNNSNIGTKWASYAPQLQSILRIVAAIMFMSAGTMKLFGIPSPPKPMSIELFSQLGLAGVLEVFGGALLLIGLFTRPVAFLLAGEMAVAYFQGHASHGFWPTVNGGQPAVLYCFIWLYYSAAGAGAWSLDAMRRK
jgi:putative oxidoreductase